MQNNFLRISALGLTLGVSVAGLAAAWVASDEPAKAGIYIDAKSVKDAFAKPGGGDFYSVPGGPEFLRVRAGHRAGTGMSEQHADNAVGQR